MVSDLELSHGPTVLPIAFESLFAATLEDQLHLVGLDETRSALHLAVDKLGEIVDATSSLALMEVTGLAACAGSLVVSGVTTGDRPTVLRVARDGRVLWRAELPRIELLQHWPRPVCVGRATWLFSTTRGTHAAMCLMAVAGDSLSAPLSFALADDTDTIDVLGEPAGVMIARVHDNSQCLELVRIEGGRVTARNDVDAVRPTSPSLARVGDEFALGWVTGPSEPHLQWFDRELKPLRAPDALPTPSQSGQVESVRLMSGSDGALAIVFRLQNVVGDGRTLHNDDGTLTRQEPGRRWPLVIAAYDVASRRLGPQHLIDSDAKLYACAWLDSSRLAVVWRRRETRLSIFERKVLKTL